MRDEGPQPARRRRTRRDDIPSSPGCANYITGVTLSITTESNRGGRSRDHEWWPVSERVVSGKRLFLFPREHKVPSMWLELLKKDQIVFILH